MPTSQLKCTACNGKGEFPAPKPQPGDPPDTMYVKAECPACHGTGTAKGQPTPREHLLLTTLKDLLPFLETEFDNRSTRARGTGEYLEEARNALNSADAAVAACTCTE